MHRRSLGVALALLLTLAPASRAQDLSAAEKALARFVGARLGEEMAALEKVVNIDSGTFNTEGVREVGRFFEKELQSLQGHSFQNDGRVIRGAGVIDMKGGDVVLLFALKALESAGMLKGATVRVFLTGDEANPGLPTSESRRDLVRAAKESDVGLAFEAGIDNTIALGRRGLSTWSLDVTGSQGHSSGVLRPTRGAGAIYEASRILDGFRVAFSAGNVTVNPGLVLGGTDVAAANLPKTSAELEFDDIVPGWPITEGNRSVLKRADTANRSLGQPALIERDPLAGGFGDANFVGSLLPVADGFGARGEGFHSPDESLDPKSVAPVTQRAAVLIGRLLHETK